MKHSPHYGPSLVFLAGAVIIAGAIVWQGRPPAPAPEPTITIEPLAEPKPLPAECDALQHYNPDVIPPLYGKVGNVSAETLEVRIEEKTLPVALTSTTRVIAYADSYKPNELWQNELADFKEKMKICNDGKRAYQAPQQMNEKTIAATELKPGQGIQVMFDNTVGDGKTAAGFVLVYPAKAPH